MNNWFDNPVVVALSSIVLFVLLVMPFIISRKWEKRKLFIPLYFLGIVFAMRFIVTLNVYQYASQCKDFLDEKESLNVVERFFDSFVHSFQTFSMDEDYTSYTVVGKEMLDNKGLPHWAFAYGLFSSFINFIAPIFGGFVVLDILISIFPKLKIIFFWSRHKYVFSELNEMSISLAEDICKNERYKEITPNCKWKPMIIFTDSYVDDESENSSELLARAKKIDGICIKDDLLELNLHKSRSVTYLLIDSKPENNITTFSKLLNIDSEENDKKRFNMRFPISEDARQVLGLKEELDKLKAAKNTQVNTRNENSDNNTPAPDPIEDIKKQIEELTEKAKDSTRIFIFIQEDHESETVHNILNNSPLNNLIGVRTIRDYLNAAINLMTDVPLFLPLLYREKTSETTTEKLTITIVGSGTIASDVFKTMYWCGQMLNVDLNVNVISSNASSMKNQLKESCPEMLECCNLIEQTDPAAPADQTVPTAPTVPSPKPKILNIYNTGSEDKAPYYLENLKFTDIPDISFISSFPEEILKNTDYYVIALGSDSLNHQVTNRLSNELSKRMLKSRSKQEKECPEAVVIVPAIFDTEMAKAMQVSKNDKFDASLRPGPFIMPFASFETRFSCQNVFFTSYIKKADETHVLYSKKQQKKWSADEYNWMSSLMKEVHADYKLFSIGQIERSDGDIAVTPFKRPAESQPAEITSDQYHDLAWLEHRRWNAYMRSQGFTCPDWDTFGEYIKYTKSNKELSLKLHPCIVESKKGMSSPLDLEKVYYNTLDPETYNKYPYDRLDYVSAKVLYELIKIDPNFSLPSVSGYKMWDYYGGYVDTCPDFAEKLAEPAKDISDIEKKIISEDKLEKSISDFLNTLEGDERNLFIKRYYFRQTFDVIAGISASDSEEAKIKLDKAKNAIKKTSKSLWDYLVGLCDNVTDPNPDTASKSDPTLNKIRVFRAIEKACDNDDGIPSTEKANRSITNMRWDDFDPSFTKFAKPYPLSNYFKDQYP